MTAQRDTRRNPPGTIGRLTAVIAVGVCVWGGCATRGNVELLEAELRRQEERVRQYQTQVSDLRQELALAWRELDQLRGALARSEGVRLAEEQTRALAAATGLTIHSLLTGGQDRDGRPGDDVIHAVLYPSDERGELVKLAGALEIEVIELSEQPRPLGQWSFTTEQARELWHSGFLTSGFKLELPWAVPPQHPEVLLKAKLHTPDGRTFQATRVVTIDPGDFRGLDRPVPEPYVPESAPPARQADRPARLDAPGGDVARPPRSLPLGAEMPTIPLAPTLRNSAVEGSSADRQGPREVRQGSTAGDGLRTSDNWTDATIPPLR